MSIIVSCATSNDEESGNHFLERSRKPEVEKRDFGLCNCDKAILTMDASSTPPTPLEQMELRILELEMKLFGAPSFNSLSTNADVSSRLAKLMRLVTDRRLPAPATPPARSGADASKRADSKRVALHEEFRTIDRLISELEASPLAGPSAAAGAGGAVAPPLGYRRMEVLASAGAMKQDMDLLRRVRDLTSIATKATAAGTGNVDESKVVNCPIMASERYGLPSDAEAAERLERLCFRVARLNQRTAVASRRADEMLNSYGKIMMALSEKMVLAEEQIKG